MSFFISIVFRDIVKIVSSDDNGSLHFGGDADAFQDSASDGDVAGEGAFLIDVSGFDGLFGSFEAESDVLEVPDA